MKVSDFINNVMSSLPVADPETWHHFSSGMYAKQMNIPAGYSAFQHKHEYDHLSILATGRVIVQTDDGQVEYTAPSCITIKQNINHAIHALEDSTWFCIHVTDETDEEEVDKVLIKKDEV
jgi:quercetin dioxygenase-like cupin family protein